MERLIGHSRYVEEGRTKRTIYFLREELTEYGSYREHFVIEQRAITRVLG